MPATSILKIIKTLYEMGLDDQYMKSLTNFSASSLVLLFITTFRKMVFSEQRLLEYVRAREQEKQG